MVDVSRDPRWGRVVEGFGEDVHLTVGLGARDGARLPGRATSRRRRRSPRPPSTSSPTASPRAAATTTRSTSRRTACATSTSSRSAPPSTPGVASVMASFNTVAGMPMHANRATADRRAEARVGLRRRRRRRCRRRAQPAPPRCRRGPRGCRARMAYAAGLDVEMGGAPSDVAAALTPDVARPGAHRRCRRPRARASRRRSASSTTRTSTRLPSSSRRPRPLASWSASPRPRAAVLLKNDGTLPLRAPSRVLLTGPYAESTDHLGAWTQSFAAPVRHRIADELRASPARGRTCGSMPGVSFFGDRRRRRPTPSRLRRARATS